MSESCFSFKQFSICNSKILKDTPTPMAKAPMSAQITSLSIQCYLMNQTGDLAGCFYQSHPCFGFKNHFVFLELDLGMPANTLTRPTYCWLEGKMTSTGNTVTFPFSDLLLNHCCLTNRLAYLPLQINPLNCLMNQTGLSSPSLKIRTMWPPLKASNLTYSTETIRYTLVKRKSLQGRRKPGKVRLVKRSNEKQSKTHYLYSNSTFFFIKKILPRKI